MSDQTSDRPKMPSDRGPTELEESDWDEVVDEMKTLPKGGAALDAADPASDEDESDEAMVARQVVSALASDSIPEIAPEVEEPGVVSAPRSVPRSVGKVETLVIGTMAAGRGGATSAAGSEHGLVEELKRRADAADKSGDAIVASRARTELALVLEVVADDREGALLEHVRAHMAAPAALAPILGARWLTPLRPVGPALTMAMDHLRAVSDDAGRVERCVEVARLHQAAGTVPQAREYYRQALAARPNHPSALRGLEGLLQGMARKGDAESAEALASHLEQMATAWGAETRLAAWLHVERAALLDRLGRRDAARSALHAALAHDGNSPHVRRALARHLSNHHDDESLVAAWSDEAGMQDDPKRAARLEYAAARLASERLDDLRTALELHGRAAQRQDADGETRRAALREIARLNEQLGTPRRAAEAWQKLLPLLEHPAQRAYLHRRLSEVYELLGEPAEAAAHGEQYLLFEPDDVETRERIDRAWETLGQHARRVTFWSAEAARGTTPAVRAEAFARAAAIAERQLGNAVLAQSMYRAAWAADPTHVDAFDGLARLLARPGVNEEEAAPADVRARIDLYEQAAVAAGDTERKIASLERVAAIYEDELQLHARALHAHRRILALDPARRSAMVGIERTAARCGDYEELVKALVTEAGLVSDPALQRTLLLRASSVAADSMGDPDRAVAIIGRVLQRSPGDLVALRASWRANYRNSRHEDALAQLRLLLKHSRRGPSSYALCVEMALLLEDRLHRNADAVQAWREAHRQDPSHPVPPLETCRLLMSLGQHRQAADELMQMAERAADPTARSRLLARAAELFDDRLEELDAALAALQQAHASAPDDEAIFERLVRVLERKGKAGDLVTLLEKRLAATAGAVRMALQFQLATLLVGEKDHVKAAVLLEELLAADPAHVGAQRLLEQSLRRTESWNPLAAMLRTQADQFASPDIRAASLWEARFLEEHRDASLPATPTETLHRIRRIQPSNPFVHEALIRATGLTAPSWEDASSLAASLSIASTVAGDVYAAAALDLATALVIERAAREHGAAAPPEAMQRYRACLARWPDCLSAARGLLRVAHAIGDQLATIEAHVSLGSIEAEAPSRAEHCAVAADMLISAGTGEVAKATQLYARALDEDPDQGRAAAGIVGLLERGADPGQVADALRGALERASALTQVAVLGGALATIARERLNEPNVAVEALRRVRAKAPGHVPTLVALAEACNEVLLGAEAADAARAALAISQDGIERMRAMLSLAEAHAGQQETWGDARREAVETEVAAEALEHSDRLRVIERLERVYLRIRDEQERERLTCMAVALSGTDGAALGRLAHMFRPDQVETAIGYVQALNRVVAMAEVFDVPKQPSWLIEMGRVEAGILSRSREGLARLREAIALDPTRLESTIALADALAVLGAHDEAMEELRGALSKHPPAKLEAGAVVAVLLALGRSLQASGRNGQAAVTEEILACVGYGTEERLVALRSRRPAEIAPGYGCLERPAIERSILPRPGQGVALRIAQVLDDVIPKLLPIDPIAARLPSSARLGPRSPHPLRQLADRYAQAFGGLSFDLCVEVPGLPLPKVIAGSPPAVLLPLGFDRLPPTEQVAGIVRLLCVVSLGVPWFEELGASDLDGLLLGALHVGRAGWDAGALPAVREQAAALWRPRIAKLASRKQRKALDELVDEASLDLDGEAWRGAVRAASWRCAWILSADWIATFNHVWRTDAEVGRVYGAKVVEAMFGHPILRDLLFWAISTEAAPLVRALLRS